MKGKKIIYLLLALVLPILIFVFLKKFGHNEFTVVSLFQNKSLDKINDCGVDYQFPYTVEDSVLAYYGIGEDYTVLIFSDTSRMPLIQLVKEQVKKDPIKFVTVLNENSFLTSESKGNIIVSEERFFHDKKCSFLLTEPLNVVLVDMEGTIYGQYNSQDRDEADRLWAELLILLKKY